jgi:membrane fusion protein (multidrug efflux system)
MKRYVLSIVIMAAVAAALFGCSKKPSAGEAAAAPVVDVKAAPVTRGDVAETVVAEGSTDAVRKEKVLAPIAGTVIAVNGIEGSPVRAGDTLAIIRASESEAAIEGAKTLLDAAKTEAEKEEARRGYRLAVSSQSVAAARSTSDGIIATRSINRGEIVAEGTELFTITDLSSIYFAANVPLRDLRRVRVGQDARVSFSSIPGAAVPATVVAIDPAADPQSQSVRAHLAFGRLAPAERAIMKTDVFGTARIATGMRKGVLLVPRTALLRNEETNETSVVVVTRDSIAVTVPVVTGVIGDSLVEVASPALQAGQLVIVEGNYGLPDSTRVRITALEKP